MRRPVAVMTLLLLAAGLLPQAAMAASPLTLNRLVIVSASIEPQPLDEALLITLCGDEDGCEVVLSTDPAAGLAAANKTHLFVRDTPGGFWYILGGLIFGEDGSGGVQTVLTVAGTNCTLRDGDAFGDTEPGFFLRSDDVITCRLVISD